MILSGIIGIYSKNRKDIIQIVYYGLYALQHRGQASAGIAVNNNGFIDYHKGLGLAHEVFSKDIIDRLMREYCHRACKICSFSKIRA